MGIADMLVQSGLQSSQQAPDITGNLQQGAALGLHIQQIQQQRAELEQKQAEHKQALLENFNNSVAKVHEFKDASSRSQYVKFLKSQNQQLGLGVPDASLDFAFASPENIARVGTLQTMVGEGKLTGEQAMSVLSDPSKFSELVPKDKYQGPSWDGANLKDVDIQTASDEIAKASAQHQANEAQKQRAGSYQTQANTRIDEQAAQAVNRINTDDALKTMTQQHRNIDKALKLTGDPKNPPSVTTMNEVAQDVSAALAGKGISSDFKLKEINQKTVEGQLQNLKAYLSSNPDQPAPPDVVKFWNDMAGRLSGAYDRQIGARANTLKQEARTVYKHNPAAAEAAESIAETYANGSWSGAAPKVNILGRYVTPEQAKAFIKAHPEHTKEIDKSTLKSLGF